jgi:bacillolysin/neutral peptidase B
MHYQEVSIDYFGRKRIFCCEQNFKQRKHLEDKHLKVRTYYFNFLVDESLPGRYVYNPPNWQKQSVSAHANTSDVAKFFKDVLGHTSTDNEVYTSTLISCEDPYPNHKLWENGMWLKDYQQVVFGQGYVKGQLCSYAVAIDIVAHDFTHALISWTVALDYQLQSGAIDESYADIFAVMVANYPNDINRWKWKLGVGFGEKGAAVRDISAPKKYGQPEHMSGYHHLCPGEYPNADNDWGWVHANSGIHNKAAYYLLTSKNSRGEFLFDPQTAGVLFYQALRKLRPNANFTDSVNALLLTGKTLFRQDSNKGEKIQAIARAFEKVGIMAK